MLVLKSAEQFLTEKEYTAMKELIQAQMSAIEHEQEEQAAAQWAALLEARPLRSPGLSNEEYAGMCQAFHEDIVAVIGVCVAFITMKSCY